MKVASTEENIILIESLSKRFKNNIAVNDVTLDVKRGEIFGLVGADGAGKTTLTKMICGILPQTSGVVLLDGYNVEKEPDAIKSLIGYMSQDFSLYLDLTVEENMNFMIDLRGIEGSKREKEKEKLLLFSRLESFRGRRASALSGGMKKKLALCSALIHKPKILILDEPTTAVDPLSRGDLWNILYEFFLHGITIVIATPYMDEAERCHRVALMREGRVIACGTPENLKKMVTQKVYSFRTNRINEVREVMKRELGKEGRIYGEKFRLFLNSPKDELLVLNEVLSNGGFQVSDLSEVQPNMGDVYEFVLKGDSRDEINRTNIPLTSPSINGDAIIVSRITKKFGDFTAVDDVSFDVRAGKVFGLLGPNGAGKTTMIKMLCGIIEPTSGSAIIAGCNISGQFKELKSRIGYMSQLFSLYPDLTVEENLDFFGSIYGLGKKEKKIKIEWVIELAGLNKKKKYLTKDLPGGWKQKLALGCAVMHQPAVIFLDEPTSGVDPVTRTEFWDIIYHFSEQGITTIVTTHFMDEAERCNVLGLMNGGKLIGFGTPDDLKKGMSVDCYEVSALNGLDLYSKLSSLNFLSHAALYGDKVHVMYGKRGNGLTKEELYAAGIAVDDVVKISPSLEDVFMCYVSDSENDKNSSQS